MLLISSRVNQNLKVLKTCQILIDDVTEVDILQNLVPNVDATICKHSVFGYVFQMTSKF